MKIGIISGSGLEKGDVLENLKEIETETPYGIAKLKKGLLYNEEVYIISRHGKNHEITPTNVNNRANICALGRVGCKYILATTAVGSLRENIRPGDFVILDQFINFTKYRKTTFHENFKNKVEHVSMAEPFSKKLRDYIIDSCKETKLKHHEKGTVVTIEGPQFSSKAESHMFRKWGADVINMSTAPEAMLAAEAGIKYATIAMSTDYDCWKQTEEPVTWAEIKAVMFQNSENVKKVLVKTIENIIQDEYPLASIKSKIRTIPNFPQPGIMFRDITTLFRDKRGTRQVINLLYDRYKNINIDAVAGMEARGFILGGSLAERLHCGFIPIRKKGKLPHETISQEYALEYGTAEVEIHKDAVSPNENILLVDDLIATGGTAKAGCDLIKKLNGNVVECAFIIDLSELGGKKKLEDAGYKTFTMIEFEGE